MLLQFQISSFAGCGGSFLFGLHTVESFDLLDSVLAFWVGIVVDGFEHLATSHVACSDLSFHKGEAFQVNRFAHRVEDEPFVVHQLKVARLLILGKLCFDISFGLFLQLQLSFADFSPLELKSFHCNEVFNAPRQG